MNERDTGPETFGEAAEKAETVLRTCLICEKPRSEGIHICDQFICDACEEEIVHTDVKDEKYPYFVTQMKRVWGMKKDA